MAKYKLKALSVQIGGQLHLKENEIVFDTDGKFKPLKKEIELAEKAGFLEEIGLSEKEKETLKMQADYDASILKFKEMEKEILTLKNPKEIENFQKKMDKQKVKIDELAGGLKL